MKDITLKITGKQCYESHEEEQMEFVTDGKLYVRGSAIYIVYDETDVSGMAGYKTTLKLSGDSLKMRRIGSGRPGWILKRAGVSAAPTTRHMDRWNWRC